MEEHIVCSKIGNDQPGGNGEHKAVQKTLRVLLVRQAPYDTT